MLVLRSIWEMFVMLPIGSQYKFVSIILGPLGSVLEITAKFGKTDDISGWRILYSYCTIRETIPQEVSFCFFPVWFYFM